MVKGPESPNLESHSLDLLKLQKQDDSTGHLMAESSKENDGQPDRGEPKIKTIPGDPEWVKYLNSVEW